LFEACKFDFEDGTLGGWFKTGTVFNNQPTYGDNPTARKRGQSAKQQGDYWIGGFEDRHTPNDKPGASQGDGPKGTLTSPVFKITGRYITFLIGGGCDAAWIRVELLVDYKVSIRYVKFSMHPNFSYKYSSLSRALKRNQKVQDSGRNY